MRALYPDGHARSDRGGPDGAAGRPRAVRTATLERARARAHPCRARRDRRADLVGPHRARPGRRRGRGSRPRGGARRGGPARPALRALLEDLPAPARDVLQPALAQRRRARAGVDRRPRAPDRRRRPAPDRHRRARDVRRALRHPARPTSSSSSARSRAARCSAAAAAFAAGPGGSSTSAPATRTTRSTTTPTCSGSSPTRSSGPRRVRTSRAPCRAAPMAPRGWFAVTGHLDSRCASASSASAGPASSTSPPTTRIPDTQVVALAGLEDRPRAKLAAQLRDRARGRGLGGPAGGRGPRRGQRLRPDLPARPDRHRGAEARHPRALREADRARRGRGRSAWSGPPARPTACSTSPSTTASAATSRSSRP